MSNSACRTELTSYCLGDPGVGAGVARSCRMVETAVLVDGVIAVPDVGAAGITRAATANVFPMFAGESGLIVKVA